MAHSNVVSRTMTPDVVAHRLADLLQRFPAAALGGVQWITLVRRYEAQHMTKIDLASLGHTDALSAATVFLHEVGKVVDSSDIDNPVVAIEDDIALTPSPGSLASWPSLYKTVCEIVCKHGLPEKSEGQESRGKSWVILLSQVKPLLKEHWHADFDIDGSGLCYFTEEGSVSKLKKMKHLMNHLTKWRAQRSAWSASTAHRACATRATQSAVDAAVGMKLECVESKSKNDLLLRCTCPDAAAEQQVLGQGKASDDTRSTSTNEPSTPRSQTCDQLSSVSANSELHDEIERLRSENAQLRAATSALHGRNGNAHPGKPQLAFFNTCTTDESDLADVLNDPFEPPPQMHSYGAAWAASPAASTCVGSSFGFGSGVATPLTDSCITSGYATPVPASVEQVGPAVGQLCNGVALVPVFFAMGDRLQIPNGVVQQTRAFFERHASIPSFFTQ